MALETGLRILPRIDDRACAAPGLHVFASRPVAGFATHVLGVLAFCLQPRMRGRLEITRDVAVTGLASFRADELRPGMLGGAMIVRVVVLQESRTMVSAAAPPTAQNSFSRLPGTHRVILECHTVTEYCQKSFLVATHFFG